MLSHSVNWASKVEKVARKMKTWIALLRGINVGGNNILPMAKLRELLEKLGHKNVKTYIQSGNCVFQSSEHAPSNIEEALSTFIEQEIGFRPQIIALTLDDFNDATSNIPFSYNHDTPKHVRLFFLAEPATQPNLEKLDDLKAESEELFLTDKVCYLHAPEGIGRSKLAAGIEKCVGVPTTARNLNSALKIANLAKTIATEDQ